MFLLSLKIPIADAPFAKLTFLPSALGANASTDLSLGYLVTIVFVIGLFVCLLSGFFRHSRGVRNTGFLMMLVAAGVAAWFTPFIQDLINR